MIADNSLEVREPTRSAVKFLNFLVSTAKNVTSNLSEIWWFLMNYPASRISCLSLIHKQLQKSCKSHTCEHPRAGGGGERGLPYKKCKGAWQHSDLRTSKRYQDHVLWAWLEILSPLRGATHNFNRDKDNCFLYLFNRVKLIVKYLLLQFLSSTPLKVPWKVQQWTFGCWAP